MSLQTRPRFPKRVLANETYSFVKSPPGVFVDLYDPNSAPAGSDDAGSGAFVSTLVTVVLLGITRTSTADEGTWRSVSASTVLFQVPSSFRSDVYFVVTPPEYSTPDFGRGDMALKVRSDSWTLYWSR